MIQQKAYTQTKKNHPWHPRHTCLLTGTMTSGVHLSAADMTTPGGDKAGTRNIRAPGGVVSSFFILF